MIEQPIQEHHKMVLTSSHPNGVDEMYCPTCGRRILIQWPPDYKKTILDTGDEYAIHSAGKGGLEMGAPQIAEQTKFSAQVASIQDSAYDGPVQFTAQDEARLAQWEKWLDQIGFEGWWSGKV